MNFTTPTNVQMFLNKTSLEVSESALVTMLIGMVDGVIKNYCGWEILAKNYTVSLDGDGSSTLQLDQAPVNSVASLLIGDVDYTSSVIILQDDGILSFPSTSGTTFSQGTGNISITYNAGYAASPPDLAYAASWLVAINYNRITQESIGIVSEQFNTIKVEYDKADIPVMVKHVLDRYRHISIY